MSSSFYQRIVISSLILVFTIPLICQGQKEANWWYFGRFAGLNFNNIVGGLPQPMTNGGMDAREANSTISDENGNLLFYTDGQYVWDATHDTMPNGQGLIGHESTTQCIIVPNPANPKKYYIFSVDYVDFRQFRGFVYTEVDLSLRGGLGDVIPATKNTHLNDTIAERMTAVRMKGKVGYWVIVHRYLRNNTFTNEYLAYAVTASGVSRTPVVSKLGPLPQKFDYATAFKASPCGDRIATLFQNSGTVVLMDFDPYTGKLSNARSDIYRARVPRKNLYGLEFSGDGSLLYTATVGFQFKKTEIYQYETSARTSFAFVGSKVTLTDPKIEHVFGMQRGPDGKIYFLYGSPVNLPDIMGVIHEPNTKGTGCRLSPNGPQIPAGASIYNELGLPNFVSSIFCPEPMILTERHCFQQKTVISVNQDLSNKDSVMIFFNDPQHPEKTTRHIPDSHQYAQPGTYQIMALLFSTKGTDVVSDTLYKTIEIVAPQTHFLGTDTSICPSIPYTISSAVAFDTYHWNTGNKHPVLPINTAGTYTLQGIKNGCPSLDTINIDTLTTTYLSLDKDTAICENESYVLEPLELKPNVRFSWDDGSTVPTRVVQQPGIYWLQSGNKCHLKTDSITITSRSCSCAVTFPNVFTPNGDRVNDFFYPNIACPTTKFNTQIFNRWGQPIFSTTDPNEAWDGLYNRKKCSPGVYFWVTQYQLNGEPIQTVKGHVSLIR